MSYRLTICTILIISISFALISSAVEPSEVSNQSSKYLDAVRTFADNVLKYGRDTYGPKHTPLFVDGLNVNTREPVNWRYGGQIWTLSDLASQQNLFRTFDGLSKATGDPKYRQQALQAIEYAFENLRSPNGLLHWGGHIAYDLLADKMCTGQYVHELKCNFPYYELMWEVDAKATENLIEAFWSAHVLDWSNLDMNRHGDMRESLPTPWEHEYKLQPVFFESTGLSFSNTGSDLFYSGAILYKLSGSKESLTWSKRLSHRYVETRNPKTGIGGSQYTRLKVDRAEQQFGDAFPGHIVLEGTLWPPQLQRTENLISLLPEELLLEIPVLESVMRPKICQLLIGETLGEDGKEFTQWAVEELRAYGKKAYRKGDNSFIPMLTDGTSLVGYTYTKDGYYGPRGTVVKPIPAGPLTFWTYTLAYRVTGDKFMWEMARSIAMGNGFGDIGPSPMSDPHLGPEIDCSSPHVLLGFLELYHKVGKTALLNMASKIGDNILLDRFHKGFFVLSEAFIYTKFDCIEPLVLLHLDQTVNKRASSPPLVWPSRSSFSSSYDGHPHEEDTVVIYSQTKTNQLTKLLQEAAWDGDVDAVKSLVSQIAGVNANGCIALHYAAEKGHKEVAELLTAHGANVNARNNAGQTPLHIATERGHLDVVQLLLESGADVNTKDRNGRTPMDLAQNIGHEQIIDLLHKQMLVHDVAITKVSATTSCVQGETVPIIVTLENRGDCGESFEVRATDVADGKEIGSPSATFSAKYQSAADADLVFTGENPGDYFTIAVVSQGDLNGDSFEDLLITASRCKSGTNKRGRAYLYYGKSDLSCLSADLILNGEDANAQLGQDAFFGDVNGDGIDDMVIGAWGYNNNQGRVYLYYGKKGGISAHPDKIFEAESGLTNSEFGFRTVLGDINNDGCADLAVYADNYGGNDAGRVYLYYGAPGTSMDTTCDLIFDGAGGKYDCFGRSVIIGEDINGDGYGDLVIGSLGWEKEKGRAYIFLGDKREKMDTVCDLILTGENKGDRFTRYFDVGDINGDKIADMAIGASWLGEYEGRVYIYYGDPNLANLANCDATIDGPITSAFGVGVLLGDVNGDGIEDLMVGASGYPRGQQWGRVWVYYGGDHSFDRECDMIFDGEARKTNFGRYMDVGDLDNDGHAEIIIGAWAYPDFTAQGRAYVFRGEDRSISREVTFNWDTSNASIGEHTLKVEIPPVPGERNTEDNVKTVTIEITGFSSIIWIL